MPKIYPQFVGDSGVRQTVLMMKKMITDSSVDPLIRKQAFIATKYCDRSDHACKSYGVLNYAKDHIHYVYDPTKFELLQDPRLFAKAIDMDRIPYGDCDDFSLYIASLLMSIGERPVLKVVGRTDKYHHVFVENNGITLDGTIEYGLKLSNFRRVMTVNL